MSKSHLRLCAFNLANPPPPQNGLLLQKALFTIYSRTSDPLQSEPNFKARLRDIYAEARDGKVIDMKKFISALRASQRSYGPRFMGH